MRRLKIGDKPDQINICPLCARRLPDPPEAKIGSVYVCGDGTWKFNGKDWEVVIVADDWDVIEDVEK